jgi:hypothetical protein
LGNHQGAGCNWTLPRLLPVRMLDAGLAKALGLTKP